MRSHGVCSHTAISPMKILNTQNLAQNNSILNHSLFYRFSLYVHVFVRHGLILSNSVSIFVSLSVLVCSDLSLSFNDFNNGFNQRGTYYTKHRKFRIHKYKYKYHERVFEMKYRTYIGSQIILPSQID